MTAVIVLAVGLLVAVVIVAGLLSLARRPARTLTIGSATFTKADEGSTVHGMGVPPGTTIRRVVSPTTVTIGARRWWRR